MADFAEWGGGGGISQAIADQGSIAHANLQRAQTAMSNAQLPYAPQKMQADIMQSLSTAALHTADAGLRAESLRQVKGMSAAMQALGEGRPTETGGDPTDPLIDMAGNMVRAAVRSGSVKDAETWASSYNQLIGHKNTAMKNQAEAKHREQQERLGDYDEIARQVDIIQALPLDQQVPAYKEMNRYFTQKRKEPVPWRDLPWNPQTAEILKNAALSQKDKVANDYKQWRQESTDAYRDIKADNAILGRKLELMRIENQERQFEARKKAGGAVAKEKPVGMPSKAMETAVAGIIKTDYPDLKGPGVSAIITDIAAEAKEAMIKNPGLRPSDAYARAYQNNKERLDGVDAPGTGRSFKNPAPAPKDKKFKAGVVYDIRPGGARYLGGDKWEVPDTPAEK